MSKILKNNTASAVPLPDTGNTVPASGQLTIQVTEYVQFAKSANTIEKLADGTLTLNDGSNDLALSDALDHLKGFYQKLQTTEDNRQLVAPNRIPAGYTLYPTAAGSDISSGTYQGGTQLKWTASGVKDFQFKDHWYAIGGRGIWKSGLAASEISAWLMAPATAGTSNTGAGEYDKVEVFSGSGKYIYIPNGTTTGDWDINLSTTLNANVSFTKAVPVAFPHLVDGKYYFDYDITTNTLTKKPNGDGKYNLYDSDFVIFNFANRIPGVDSGELALDVEGIVGKVLLPHWKIKFKATVGTGAELGLLMIMAVKQNIDVSSSGIFGTPWS